MESLGNGEKESSAVVRSERKLRRPFGMGHHTHNISGFVCNPGNTIQGAIRVGLILQVAARAAIPENYLAITFDAIQISWGSKKAPLIMSDWDGQHLTRLIGSGKTSIHAIHPNTYLPADELQPAISQHCPGKQ